MQYLNKYFIVKIILFLLFINNINCQEKENNQNHSKDQIQIDNNKTISGRILAGILSPSQEIDNQEYLKIIKTKIYESHYDEMQKAWKKAEEVRLKKIRDWVQLELAHLCNKNYPVFYPFSGPDILNAEILFPCAQEYILFGLEPPGYLRDITSLNHKDLNRYLYYIRDSLKSILNYSFFRTNDMKIDFFKELDGVAPVLLTFLTYNKNQIIRITPVRLLPDGIVEDNLDNKGIKGIRFYYKNIENHLEHNDKIKMITYFQIDISNSNLKQNQYFLEILQKKSPYITFLKAASYLMYRNSFSDIRNFILNYSDYIIQDDSGIPIKYFDTTKWKLTFYGNYTKPIKLFINRYQPELREIYKDKKNIKPLPFGTGYQFYPGTSNLMIAEKIKN
ncbi:MAG: hypothetical protein KatS3mg129_1768 [Leptospiraceae bacterium]|nr:MAG: hypothetical protein KatS3mg129_1768 [Leptospiraceae bacterium]